ncbi:RNA polymerase sigma factor [Kiloniella sp. EL199]|uniref:RNA polymerase sigma factor n=1 Tax=Kiloniella sp. EL199 TaxID=2107581 RepID=UPI000EA408BF|nr:RNA polymerase sigma factor [Kiloniella sp. EL199]
MDEFLDQLTKSIPVLRRYAYALVKDSSKADDLVQDCLERSLTKRHQWKGQGSLKPWLYRILSNIHLNHYRQSKTNPIHLPAELNERTSMGLGTDTTSQQLDHLYLRDLDQAITQLPDDQKQVLLLVALEGLSYSEVAAITQVPLGTVMSRLSRAREALRKSTTTQSPTKEPLVRTDDKSVRKPAIRRIK